MSTVITGAGIPLYRLMVLRGGVKLEAKGFHTRGRSFTAIVKKELGLKRNASRDIVLAALDLAIAAQETKLEPDDIRRA
jgi:hypothetical protein